MGQLRGFNVEKTKMYAILENNKVVGYTYESVPGSILLTDEEYLRQISHHAMWLYNDGVFTPHPRRRLVS